MSPPVKSGSMADVSKTHPRDKGHIYENTKSSPSKSSTTSGGSDRSESGSSRSVKIKNKSTENLNETSNIEEDKTNRIDTKIPGNDGDVTDRDKLHDVTCLSLPPAGTHKTQIQTDSFTTATPTAEQMRRDSLLGSLPPLEPVAMASEVTADINAVLGMQHLVFS